MSDHGPVSRHVGRTQCAGTRADMRTGVRATTRRADVSIFFSLFDNLSAHADGRTPRGRDRSVASEKRVSGETRLSPSVPSDRPGLLGVRRRHAPRHSKKNLAPVQRRGVRVYVQICVRACVQACVQTRIGGRRRGCTLSLATFGACRRRTPRGRSNRRVASERSG